MRRRRSLRGTRNRQQYGSSSVSALLLPPIGACPHTCEGIASHRSWRRWIDRLRVTRALSSGPAKNAACLESSNQRRILWVAANGDCWPKRRSAPPPGAQSGWRGHRDKLADSLHGGSKHVLLRRACPSRRVGVRITAGQVVMIAGNRAAANGALSGNLMIARNPPPEAADPLTKQERPVT